MADKIKVREDKIVVPEYKKKGGRGIDYTEDSNRRDRLFLDLGQILTKLKGAIQEQNVTGALMLAEQFYDKASEFMAVDG